MSKSTLSERYPYGDAAVPGALCKLLVLVALSVFSLSSSLAAQEVEPEDAEALVEAQQSILDQQFESAIEVLEALRSKYPTLPDIPNLLTHAHYGMGNYAEARQAAIDSIAAGRFTPDVLTRLAQIDGERNDAVALLNIVRLLTILDADNRLWRISYADLLADAGDLQSSAAVYQSLLEDEPESSALHLRLGNVLLKQQRVAEAAFEMETAWHLGSTNQELPATIANAWQRAGDERQSLAWLERTLSMQQPKDEQLQLRIAKQHRNLKQLEFAKEVATTLVTTNDRTVRMEAHVLLGQIALEQQQIASAVQHWRSAVSLGANSPQMLIALGGHYFNAGDYALAADYLKQAVDQDDQVDERTVRFLVLSLVRNNQLDLARTYLVKYISNFAMTEQAKDLVRAWSRAKTESVDRALPDGRN